MHTLVGVLGWAVILVILWDVFETIILPRRISRRVRLTRFYYKHTWRSVSGFARRLRPGKWRERFLG
ncbi:MAG: two pore domain potassium channel family protein, partial [Acidobacteriota bacterium]|nr:two pore domain potassium channel family protein [Acidobacteriota bacterium]